MGGIALTAALTLLQTPIYQAKTRLMVQALSNLVGSATALVLMPEKDQAYDTVMRCTGNMDDAKVLLASYINIRDLFGYDKVVLPLASLDLISQNLG